MAPVAARQTPHHIESVVFPDLGFIINSVVKKIGSSRLIELQKGMAIERSGIIHVVRGKDKGNRLRIHLGSPCLKTRAGLFLPRRRRLKLCREPKKPGWITALGRLFLARG